MTEEEDGINVLQVCLVKLCNGRFAIGYRDGDRFCDEHGNRLNVLSFDPCDVWSHEHHMVPFRHLYEYICFFENLPD